MKHFDCKNFVHLDCEKGMCALSKMVVAVEGDACPKFVQAEKCGVCAHFTNPDKYGIGLCKGFEKENWAYNTCGAAGCEKFKMR